MQAPRFIEEDLRLGGAPAVQQVLPEAKARVGRGEAWLERVIPPMRRLPVRWRSAIRGLGRARRRSAASIVGVMLATMLVLVSWGFIDSIQVLLDRQFVRIQRYDAQLYVGGRPADEIVADVFEVRAEGDGPLAQFMDLTFFGDVVSLHLAVDLGVDPGPIPLLDDIKRRLRE